MCEDCNSDILSTLQMFLVQTDVSIDSTNRDTVCGTGTLSDENHIFQKKILRQKRLYYFSYNN